MRKVTISTRTARELEEGGEEWAAATLVRGEAEGALPIGTIVEKCNSNPDDSYPDGTRGLVLSSLDADGEFGYFVVFAVSHPLPVLISGERIRELKI